MRISFVFKVEIPFPPWFSLFDGKTPEKLKLMKQPDWVITSEKNGIEEID